MGEKKKIAVILRSTPLGSVRASEALRSTVGTTMMDDDVTLILAGDGVYCLLDTKPEAISSLPIKKHLEGMKMLKKTVVAEKESLDERSIQLEDKFIQVKTRDEIVNLLNQSDHVVTW